MCECVCICVHMYACEVVYVCTVCVCVHVCIHACVCACEVVYMYVCDAHGSIYPVALSRTDTCHVLFEKETKSYPLQISLQKNPCCDETTMCLGSWSNGSSCQQ